MKQPNNKLLVVALGLIWIFVSPASEAQRRGRASAGQAGRSGVRKPPALTPFPTNPQLSDNAREDIAKALKNYPLDQVSGYLTFRETAQNKRSNLNEAQTKWVQDTLVALKPHVMTVLKQDLTFAQSRSDVRAAYLALLTLLTVAENDSDLAPLIETLPKVSALLKAALEAKTSARPVWQITRVSGEFTSAYSESAQSYPFKRTEISPTEKGYQILRVRAHLKNISLISDPAYTPWALAGWKRVFLSDSQEKTPRPSRLADCSLIHAVAADNSQSFPCSFVTSKNTVLRDKAYDDAMSLLGGMLGGSSSSEARTLGEAIQKIRPGAFVRAGAEFDIDVLFPAPETLRNFRLLVIGAPSVPITIGRH